MEIRSPYILLLIPLIITIVIIIQKYNKHSSFRFPSILLTRSLPKSWKARFVNITFFLRWTSLALFTIALSGPRTVLEETQNITEGVDIVLTVDCSGSMAAEDFKLEGRRLNRLEAVKRVVSEFIDERKHDRLGLVAFSAEAYSVCPLTTDRQWLKENLNRLDLGLIKDGTAIGSAIVSSLSRIKNSDAKSKIIILLTDGVNNAGKIDPISAAKAAKAMNVKIYTIGAGTKGFAPFPVKDFFGRIVYQNERIEIDEEILNNISKETNGKYFRATDTESLRNIYKEIDSLEKTEIEEYGYKEYKELFGGFLIFGLVILLIEILLSNTIFLKVP